MNQTLSLQSFVSQLELESSLTPKEIESIVFDLFVHIRTNTECGLWVEVEDFGSFHPLWYALKKHKDSVEDARIVEEIEQERAKQELEIDDECKEQQTADVKDPAVLANEAELLAQKQAFAEDKEHFAKQHKSFEKLKAQQYEQIQESMQEQSIIEEELRHERETLQVNKEAFKNEQELFKQDKAVLAQSAQDSGQTQSQEQAALEKSNAELGDELEVAKQEAIRQEEMHELNDKAARELLLLHDKQIQSLEDEKKALEVEIQSYEKSQVDLAEINEERSSLAKQLKQYKKDKKVLDKDQAEVKALSLKLQKEFSDETAAVKNKRSFSLKYPKHEGDNKKRAGLFYLGFFVFGLILGGLFLSQSSVTIKKVPSETVLFSTFKAYEQEAQTTEKFYEHSIVKGENLYTLSQKLYADSKFWPLIFVENMKTIKDMDKVYPGNILQIPRIPQSSSAKKELAEVYIKAYKAYKNLGKDNDAHWLLYWGSQNIDGELLERYKKDILLDDSEKVKAYLKRFGLKE